MCHGTRYERQTLLIQRWGSRSDDTSGRDDFGLEETFRVEN